MAPTYTEADLELALADLAKQDTPNYSAASKKYGVPRRTLSNRFTGKSVSRQAAAAEYHQRLDTAQEEALIELINRLTNRGLPPTNSIVKNLAEEIIGGILIGSPIRTLRSSLILHCVHPSQSYVHHPGNSAQIS